MSDLETGDTVPTFTATRGTSDHESFDLEEHLGDGPIVLAFFPGAFTPPCTNEMVALQDHLDEFEAADATVLGVSADSAFSLGAFRDEHGIEFDLVSDMAGDAIQEYGLGIDTDVDHNRPVVVPVETDCFDVGCIIGQTMWSS